MTTVAKPCQIVAKLITMAGVAEYRPDTSDNWHELNAGIKLCANSQIRVGKNSRINIRLTNNTIIKLKENSLLKFSPTKQNKFVNLLSGVGHFISRIKKSFEVKTPLVNAFIEGTEFLVSITPKQGQVSVLEGKVRTYNKHGTVTLSAGQISVTKVGKAPILKLDMQAQDELNWAINYPISLFNTKNPTIASAINLLKSGKAGQAKHILKQPKIRQQPDSIALSALILLAENQRQAALKLLNNASTTNENIMLVKSYAYQALHDLNKATTVLKATNSEAINLRLAELALLDGNNSKARQYLNKVKPGSFNKTIYSALDLLLDNHEKQAINLLKQNQHTNQDNPQFWLIMGLAYIGKNNPRTGIKHLEQAVSLAPTNSTYRNYLGRAYLARQNFAKADAQFSLAKSMDKNDPSISLHKAISAIEQNKPSTALSQINQAKQNIDKRAVYRKTGARATDKANLLAKQGAIYKILDNNIMAAHNAQQATELVPNNTAGHQLQSDLLIGKQFHQGARINQRQRALLYSPLYRLPVLPSLSDQNLILLNDAALFTAGLHEYDDLFANRGIHGNLNLFTAGQNTKSAELGLNLIGSNTVLSIGYLDYKTDGFFPNDFRKYKIKNLFLQHKFNNHLSIQFEHFEKEHNIGDIKQNWFISPKIFSKENENTEYNRLGLGLKLNDNWSLYASFEENGNKATILNDRYDLKLKRRPGLKLKRRPGIMLSPGRRVGLKINQSGPVDINTNTKVKWESASVQLIKTGVSTDIFGFDYGTEKQTRTHEVTSNGIPLPVSRSAVEKKKHTSWYWYRNFNLNPKININFGLEYSRLKTTVTNSKRLYPKAAISWQTGSGWLHSLAYLESVQLLHNIGRPAPFIFAGRVQNLDNSVGYQNKDFGFTSLLNKPDYSLYSQFQYSKGKEYIENLSGPTFIDKHRDYDIKLAAFKNLNKKTTIRAEFNYAKAKIKFNTGNTLITATPENLETYKLSLAFDYRLIDNITLNLTGTYVKQNIEFAELNTSSACIGTIHDSDNFFILDLEAKIKLPFKNNNYLFLGVKNATNTNFKYQDNNYRSIITSPFPYARERLFYAKLQFKF